MRSVPADKCRKTFKIKVPKKIGYNSQQGIQCGKTG